MGRLSSESKGAQQGKLPELSKQLQYHFKSQSEQIENIINTLFHTLPAQKRDLLFLLGEFFQTVTLFIDNQMKLGNKNEGDNKLRIFPHHLSCPSWKNEVLPAALALYSHTGNYSQTVFGIENSLKQLPSEPFQEQTSSIRSDILNLVSRLQTQISNLHQFVTRDASLERVRWIESHRIRGIQNIHLIDAEIDVSKHFANTLFSKFSSVILSSATLSTSNQFDWIKERIGLERPLFRTKKLMRKF